MAGQPRKHGKTPRPKNAPRWAARAAVTPAEQLTVASDRFRASLARLRRQFGGTAAADQLAREAAAYLTSMAEIAEGRHAA